MELCHRLDYWKIFVAALSILSISMTVNAYPAPFPCGYNYDPKAEAWFKIHTSKASWSKAKHICESEGAQLAAPTNDAIKGAMISLMRTANQRMIHTAMRRVDNMNNMIYRGLKDNGIKGRLVSVSESWYLPYICYKKEPQDLNLNECGTTDPEYTFDKRTNKCYKFHHRRNTWFSASITCLLEDGHLAVINSEVEAGVIRDIFARSPPHTTYWKDAAFLGYRAYFNRTWKTVTGQSLSEAGYEGWAQGEPNNAGGGENCGSIVRNGQLYDDSCEYLLPFICEKRTDACHELKWSWKDMSLII